MNLTDTSDRHIELSRVFRAPRDLVWEAWTRPEHVDVWWGPDGFSTTTKSMEVRPGGEWRYLMRHAQYGEFPNRTKYLEVVRPERLVYLHDSGVDGDPDAFHVTVDFAARGDETVVSMRSVFSSAAALEKVKKFGAVEGGKQTLARLDGWLKERV